MKNKNLIIIGLLAIGVYAYLDKKKKDQSKPYTDAELDKKIVDLVNKGMDFAKSKGKTQSLKSTQEAIDQTKFIFSDAKAKGKDLSKANVDKFFKIYWIVVLNQEGDTSQGVATKEDFDLVRDILNSYQPVQPVGVVQQSQGLFLPKTPVDPRRAKCNGSWDEVEYTCTPYIYN